MLRAIWPVLIAALLAVSVVADAKQPRSKAIRGDFQRLSPCPSTGKPSGKCPGYIADHVVPLCAGGPDSPSNMQWQTVSDAKAKDRLERKQCRVNKGRSL